MWILIIFFQEFVENENQTIVDHYELMIENIDGSFPTEFLLKIECNFLNIEIKFSKAINSNQNSTIYTINNGKVSNHKSESSEQVNTISSTKISF